MKRIELKKVSIVFLTMLLFLSIQIPAFAADTDTTVKIPVEQVFDSKNTDAYDALINDRPYKRKYEPEEAIRMISNGECGAFSNQLMQCFKEAAKQQNWLKRKN